MTAQIDTDALTRWVLECARIIETHKEDLNELDSASGDADHGSNLSRGFSAVAETIESPTSDSPSDLMKLVGTTLVSRVGGSSGALYGTFFLRMARAMGPAAVIGRRELGQALAAAGEGIVERGKVERGDKTLYDALAPAIDAYHTGIKNDLSAAEALESAANAADTGRDATARLAARKGRASYLGDRTIGHIDAGSASMALIINAASKTLGQS
jgi:dihydroxyacetone kinase-like protein